MDGAAGYGKCFVSNRAVYRAGISAVSGKNVLSAADTVFDALWADAAGRATTDVLYADESGGATADDVSCADESGRATADDVPYADADGRATADDVPCADESGRATADRVSAPDAACFVSVFQFRTGTA